VGHLNGSIVRNNTGTAYTVELETGVGIFFRLYDLNGNQVAWTSLSNTEALSIDFSRSDYDAEKYLGPNSVVKYRLTCHAKAFDCKEASDKISVTLDFQPALNQFKVISARVCTYSAEQKRQSELRRINTYYENINKLELKAKSLMALPEKHSVNDVWLALEQVWIADCCVREDLTGPGLRHSNHFLLISEFAKSYSQNQQLLLEKLDDPNPYIAAHAFKILTLVNPSFGYANLTSSQCGRTEKIRVNTPLTGPMQRLCDFLVQYCRIKDARKELERKMLSTKDH
jgi:hypothetical protein